MKRLRFYLLFSIIGLFTAETCSWSSPLWLINPLTFVLLRSVYGPHYLLFGSILIRTGRYRDRRKVYLFGVLLGFYEFRITKVYFEPSDFLYVFDVNLLNVIRIGFIRHAFMSFTIPFYAALMLSDYVSAEFSRPLLKKFLLTTAFFYSLIGSLYGEIIRLFLLPAIRLVYVFLLIPKEPMSLQELTLNERYAFALLLLVYTFYGLLWRRDRLPDDRRAYLLALAFYIIVLYPLIRVPPEDRIVHGERYRLKTKDFLAAYVTFAMLSLLFVVLNAVAHELVFAIFVLSVLASIPLTIYLMRRCFSHKQKH